LVYGRQTTKFQRLLVLAMDTMTTEKEFVPQYSASLVEQITEFLTNSIIEGRFKGGQRMVEHELQRRFGVSRAPIREAFLILERNGLLTSIPRKGRFIREISSKDIEENFVVRADLECLAARLAIPHIEPENIRKMEAMFSDMVRAAKRKDFNAYYSSHYEFHGTFIRASNNKTLIEILENLRCQTKWFRYSNPSANERSYEYLIPVHREILDLFIRKEDVDRLGDLVKQHILTSLEGMFRLLARSKEGSH
jgi:DNA-binding GntR family transcriptional regulator